MGAVVGSTIEIRKELQTFRLRSSVGCASPDRSGNPLPLITNRLGKNLTAKQVNGPARWCPSIVPELKLKPLAFSYRKAGRLFGQRPASYNSYAIDQVAHLAEELAFRRHLWRLV
jgi:hypothetical protein